MKLKKNSTGIDIALTFITKIAFLGGSFIVSILLARLLGPEGKGIVTALFVIPNLLNSIADLGIKQASVYYIGRKNYNSQDILSTNLLIWIFTSIISMILAYIYFSVFQNGNYENGLIIIALMYIPVFILANYVRGILEGNQLFTNINFKFMISFIVKLFTVVILVWILDLGVIGGALATLFATISELLYQIYIAKNIVQFKMKYIRSLPKKLIYKGIIFAVGFFILQLNYKIDIIFLENMVSSADVGIYSVGVTLAELVWQLPLAISFVLFAKSANSKSDKEASERTAKLLRISLFILFFGIIMFTILSHYFVEIVYGEEFQDAAIVIDILLPGVFMLVLTKILHPAFVARKYPIYVHYIFLGPLILNIVLNLITIPILGIVGAALSSTVSYTICGITYAIVYSNKMKVSFKDLVIIKRSDFSMVINSLKR